MRQLGPAQFAVGDVDRLGGEGWSSHFGQCSMPMSTTKLGGLDRIFPTPPPMRVGYDFVAGRCPGKTG